MSSTGPAWVVGFAVALISFVQGREIAIEPGIVERVHPSNNPGIFFIAVVVLLVVFTTFICPRPIFAFGNSDGDKEMLEWTAPAVGLRFMGLVLHTDADREWAYDRKSDVGRLDRAFDEAIARGWTIVI